MTTLRATHYLISSDVDEIMVEGVCAGRRTGILTVGERKEVVRRLTAKGKSLREIADRLGVNERTVCRYRRDDYHKTLR